MFDIKSERDKEGKERKYNKRVKFVEIETVSCNYGTTMNARQKQNRSYIKRENTGISNKKL